MVLLISSTNSWSYSNEVFSFQKPGPLGFVCKSIAIVTREWSVLQPGKISLSEMSVHKLELIKKKSSRHCKLGFSFSKCNV